MTIQRNNAEAKALRTAMVKADPATLFALLIGGYALILWDCAKSGTYL